MIISQAFVDLNPYIDGLKHASDGVRTFTAIVSIIALVWTFIVGLDYLDDKKRKLIKIGAISA